MKSAWHWVVVIIAWLASLGVSGAGLILASILRGGVSDEDRTVGLVIGLGAVAWLALPALGTWSLSRGRLGWGFGLLTTALVLSVLAVGLVFGAIEAAARP